MQVIINAGGVGSRLWPLSTKKFPKQFVNLTNNSSLLDNTIKRVTTLTSTNNIWIATNNQYLEITKNSIHDSFNTDRILLEPSRRDTFPAVIAHSALVSSLVNKDETFIFISSDHYIDDSELNKFKSSIELLDKAIINNAYEIILPATKPTYPATGYGYIMYDNNDSNRIKKVMEFKEKPNLEQATIFLESGNYLWNLGYFAFKYSNLKKILSNFYPESLDVLKNIEKNKYISLEDYEKLEIISFDKAILEKAQNIGVIDIDLKSWDDIGTYETLTKYQPKVTNERFLQIESNGNIVKSLNNKKIAFVGVNDLMLIESDEGILVIDPKHSQSIKEVSKYFDK
jgi:mannose-1-phosphate guanylyltransferase